MIVLILVRCLFTMRNNACEFCSFYFDDIKINKVEDGPMVKDGEITLAPVSGGVPPESVDIWIDYLESDYQCVGMELTGAAYIDGIYKVHFDSITEKEEARYRVELDPDQVGEGGYYDCKIKWKYYNPITKEFVPEEKITTIKVT